MARKETVDAVKQALAGKPKRNFSESVDLAINLKNIDLSQPKNRVDEDIILPSGLGKPVKVAVFAKGEVAVNAEKAGADYVFPLKKSISWGRTRLEQRNSQVRSTSSSLKQPTCHRSARD